MTRWLLAIGLIGGAFALANDPKPSLIEPFPFDHDQHTKAFKKTGVACVDCHPVGLHTQDDQGFHDPQIPTPPPKATCHGCHLNLVKGVPRKAPNTCTSCHADRAELVPPSHIAGWLQLHGPDARGAVASCDSCHDRAQCLDCHEKRGAMSQNPHPPAFLSIHGAEARMDPNSCSTCHNGNTCVSCHSSGDIPW